MTSNLLTRYVVIIAVLALAGLSISLNKINLGIDLRGGSILTYEVQKLSDAGEVVDSLGNVQKRDIEDTIAVISERINQEGVKDISVRQEGEQLVVLYLPDFTDAETDKIRQRMTQVGRLAFPIVATDGDEGYDGFRFSERTESTRIGIRDHSRRRAMTSTPSMSGRPRSSTTRSGAVALHNSSASLPVRASSMT